LTAFPDAVRGIECGSRIFRPIAESAWWLLQSFCGGISQASLDFAFGFEVYRILISYLMRIRPDSFFCDLEGTAILDENC